jgi:hypothetical protein
MAKADIAVSQWFLETGLQDFSGGGQQQFAFFETVQNPFIASHSAQLGPGTASTKYGFAWGVDTGSFRVDAAHVTPDLGSTTYASLSTGSIDFTTTAPLVMHLTGRYDYSLPVARIDVAMGFVVFDVRFPVNFLSDVHRDDTFLNPPHSGTFTTDLTGIIPADCQCSLRYNMRIEAFGNTGALSTGSGFYQWTLAPVPKPATLALLLAGAPFAVRRRR